MQDDKIIGAWNRVIISLIELSKTWDEFKEVINEVPRKDRERLPIEAQRALALPIIKSKFRFAIPQLIEICMARGGIEASHIGPIEKPRKSIKGKLKEALDGKRSQQQS